MQAVQIGQNAAALGSVPQLHPSYPAWTNDHFANLVVAGLQVADLFFPGHLEHTPKNMQVKKTEKRVVKKYGRNNLCIHII